MRKNLLALSIAAMVGGLSGVANAQAVGTDTVGVRQIGNSGPALASLVTAGAVKAPGAAGIPAAATTLKQATTGVGHILLVPYFSTQGSHNTLLNLVNTDQVNGKAVKLRFRGAANSDDLFDITIFLSPGDTWTANVGLDGDLSRLMTNDTSCTLPSAADIKAAGGKFSTRRVMDNAPAQTREGYVEILNMADIPAGSALYTATKHATVDGVWKAPCTPAVMAQQTTPLSTTEPANYPAARGYSWPTGGLMANWTLVDVATKASYSGEAVALRATPNENPDAAGAANIVFSPQTPDTVAPATAALLTADPLLANGLVLAANYDFPDLSTPYTGAVGLAVNQANELSAALAAMSVSNEYITDPVVSFATDWVFSMPTRRYAVAVDYNANNTVANNSKAVMVSNGAGSNYFTSANVVLDTVTKQLCVKPGPSGLNAALVPFDREEKSNSTSFVISPGAPTELTFCGETSVLSFNGKPSILGAKLVTQNINTGFTDGWMSVKTPGLGNGLPVIGYAVGKAIGPDGGNFGGTWMHRTNKIVGQPF